MKKFVVILISTALLFSCTKKENGPDLPPEESMSLDFSAFNIEKSATLEKSSEFLLFTNYQYSTLTVGFWNTVIFVNMAVPVASFKTAFRHMPVKTADNTWEWTYTVEGFGNNYHARLTGTNLSDSIEWKMYVTRTGINPYDEFLWYSGKSAKDRSGGYWVLNHNNVFPEKALQIDWSYENESIADIKFTIVRELNDNRSLNVNNGAYIHHGRIESYFDAYYNIHVYDNGMYDFTDVNIQWNRTYKDGKVKSPVYFSDEDWHCWDTAGNNTICE